MLIQEKKTQIDQVIINQCDVSIVGGGIAGLTLAGALRDSGLRVVIIESKPVSNAAMLGQAYAISLMSARIFQQIGIWKQIEPLITTISQIRLSDANYNQVINFLPSDLGTDALVYVAEHQVLLTALQDFIKSSSGIYYYSPMEVVGIEYQSDGVNLKLVSGENSYFLKTNLLVGADGARSPIREMSQIKTRGWKYGQSCIVATVKPEKDHGSIAYEKFWSSGPFAILPIPNNRCRIVWTEPDQSAQKLVNLSDLEFLVELGKRYGSQMGALELVGKRTIFPVQLRQSDRYVSSRLALIGDAAHGCHPVGGQGLNLGIRDASYLAFIIKNASQQGFDLGDIQVLKNYQNRRIWENWLILGFTDLLVRLFSNNILPIMIVRRLGLWIMIRSPLLRTLSLRLMTGLFGKNPF